MKKKRKTPWRRSASKGRKVRQRAARQFSALRKEVRLGLIAALAGAIIGIPAWLLGGKPSFGEVVEAWNVRFASPADSTHFTMLVADLVGDC